jgi:hypothetical protein
MKQRETVLVRKRDVEYDVMKKNIPTQTFSEDKIHQRFQQAIHSPSSLTRS